MVIAGNYEYYNGREAEYEVQPQISKVYDEFENVIFLNRTTWSPPTRPDLVFLGCTLWTELKIATWSTTRRLSDFYRIKVQTKPNVKFTPDIYDAWHKRDRKWLQATLEGLGNKKAVVVTHHVPSFRLSSGKHPFTVMAQCWHAPCDHLVQPPVVAWLFGHSHENVNKKLNGVRCVSNCVGYVGEGVICDPKKVMKI